MKFIKLDIENWERKSHYNMYLKDIPCTYSMTTKIDITEIINKKIKIYPAMLYGITKSVNKFIEFRMSLNENYELGYFESVLPSYTIFNEKIKIFTTIWSEYNENFNIFYKRYKEDIEKYKENLEIVGKKNIPLNSINISMIPWESFEGFNLNLQKGYNYLLPIFTIGKYYEENKRYKIPIAIQVHHAVCDGYHLCRFIECLREELKDILK